MNEVSRDEFYEYVNPRDIVVTALRDKVEFRTRQGILVGEVRPGWASGEGNTYFLSNPALRILREEKGIKP
jgi:hypothetical protein